MSNQESLVSLINQKLESADLELPVFDDIAVRLHKGVRENTLNAEEMCSLLEEDPALVSEVLRMSNSSFFSGLTEIRSLKDAAVRLGTKQVAAIVFSVSQKRLYSQSKGLFKGRLHELWQHANAVSSGARWVANTIGYRSISDEAFIAGLLHDVGKLSLLSIIEDLIASKELSLSDEIIDMTLNELYCEHGAKLLELWNLPEFFQQVVLHQADGLIHRRQGCDQSITPKIRMRRSAGEAKHALNSRGLHWTGPSLAMILLLGLFRVMLSDQREVKQPDFHIKDSDRPHSNRFSR